MASPTRTPPSPPPPPSTTTTTDRWFPYRNAGDFDANLVTILVVLLCAIICLLSLQAAVRYLLRRSRDQPTPGRPKPAPRPAPDIPALVYSSGLRLAGAEADCAICLSEFVDGERVRVLPKCQHGFHDRCVEGWLAARPSCPTCRTSCLSPSPAPAPAPAQVEIQMVRP